MTDAPETIWVETKTCAVDASGASRLLAMDREFRRSTEYRRADMPLTTSQIMADPRVQALVDALEPFAKTADTWEPDDGDSHMGARIEHPQHGLERHAEFTFGDLRKARAALAQLKEPT